MSSARPAIRPAPPCSSSSRPAPAASRPTKSTSSTPRSCKTITAAWSWSATMSIWAMATIAAIQPVWSGSPAKSCGATPWAVPGTGHVTYADGDLYFRYENGDVALVVATPKQYEQHGEFHIPDNAKPQLAPSGRHRRPALPARPGHAVLLRCAEEDLRPRGDRLGSRCKGFELRPPGSERRSRNSCPSYLWPVVFSL